MVEMLKKYSNPQIIEAVIDLRCELHPNIKEGDIKHIHEKIKKEYPKKQAIFRFEKKLYLDKGKSSETTDLGIIGYKFISTDGKYIIQFKLNGFSLSRLKPYEKWEPFRNEAKKVWEIYKSLGISKVGRVATRYINIFDIPTPIEEIENYIKGLPAIPSNICLNLETFFNRFQVHDPATDFRAIITQALQPPKNPNTASILLDLDIFKQDSFQHPFDTAWEALEKLRNFKNKIFDTLTTQKIKELIR